MINNYIVAYMDVYGFKAIIQSSHKDEVKWINDLSKRVSQAHKNMLNLIKDKPEYKPRVYIFSDSIGLCYKILDPRDRILIAKSCVADVSRILDIFLDVDLPLRGAIACGPTICRKYQIIGKPLVRAVAYENMLNAPLVLLPKREIVDDLPKSYRGEMKALRFDIIPLKENGEILGSLIFPRNIDIFSNILSDKVSEFLTYGPYNVSPAWHNAISYLSHYLPKLSKWHQQMEI